jgi:hypothetical protein
MLRKFEQAAEGYQREIDAQSSAEATSAEATAGESTGASAATDAVDATAQSQACRSGSMGSDVARRLRAGIRDKPTALASPWQNGVVERLIGSNRRECVDHIIVPCEAFASGFEIYAHYYNGVCPRAVQRIGAIRSRAILGGLHHDYARI